MPPTPAMLRLGRFRPASRSSPTTKRARALREHADRLVGQRLRERGHLAKLHQLLDHLGSAETERLGHLLDGGTRVDLGCRLLLRRLLRLRGEVRLDPRGAAPAPAAAARRLLLHGRRALLAARRLGVDYHAAAATSGSRAAALIGPALGTLRTLLRGLIGRLLRPRLLRLRLTLGRRRTLRSGALLSGRLGLLGRGRRGGALTAVTGCRLGRLGAVREGALHVALVDA